MSKENIVKTRSGWGMLAITLIVLILCLIGLAKEFTSPTGTWAVTIPLIIVLALDLFFFNGFFTLQPNEARVLVLFGSYKGTTNTSGFFWTNPLYSKNLGISTDKAKISLRARTLNGDKIKVNDKHGNPIEIAMVVVWRVHDTAQAVFDVDDYGTYVSTQSETALRHVATAYSYDKGEDEEDVSEITLRSNIEEVSAALKDELAERLAKAGVTVDDARLTHLAYAPEIAQAMLRRQQAEAIIAARKKIVEGAVSMVDMAIEGLETRNILELDDERKAAMVSNLMVVLCSDSDAQPIVNAGTLYS